MSCITLGHPEQLNGNETYDFSIPERIEPMASPTTVQAGRFDPIEKMGNGPCWLAHVGHLPLPRRVQPSE